MTIEELNVLITAETRGLRNELNSVRRQLNTVNRDVARSTTGMSAAFKKLGLVIASVFAVKKIINFGRSTVSAYNEISAASTRLAKVMQNTMAATNGQIRSVERLIAAQESIGIISAGVQIAGAQELGTYLSQSESLKTLIPTMNDMLAQQYEFNATAENAVQIGTMIGKVMDGQLGALSRYGYSWTEAQERVLKYGNEAERAAMLAEVVGQSVGGMNEALAQTPQGQMQRLLITLGSIKEELGRGIMPVIQAVLPYIQAMADTFLRAAKAAATFMAALFGTKQQIKAATATNIQAGAIEGLGEAAEEAGKKAKGALAGFDEINSLTNPSGVGGSVPGIDFNSPQSSLNLDIEEESEDISGMTEKFNKLKESLQPVIDALSRLKQALEPVKDFAAQGLKDLYKNVLVPIGQWTLGEGLPRFIDAIAKGLQGINWGAINNALNNLWTAITPFAINVGEGLLWFWENVLVPLGTWTISEVVPRFLEILAEAISILNGVIDALKPLAQWLWSNFLEPIAKWTGGVIVSVLDGIKNALKGIGDWIRDNQTTVENMAIAVGSFMLAWKIVDIALKIKGIVSALVAFISAGGLAAGIAGAFGAVIAFLTSPITIAVAAIGALIAIGILLYKNWDEISAWIKEIWEGIKAKAIEIWTAIKEFFVELWESVTAKISEVWTAISDFFIATWENIKVKAVEIWGAIKQFFSETWDSISSKITKVWTTIREFLASTWEAINVKTLEVWNAIKSFLIDSWDSIKNMAITVFTNIKDGIVKIFNEAKTVISNIWNGIKENLSNLWNNIKDTANTVFTSIKDTIENIFNAVKTSVSNIWNSITSSLSSLWNGIKNTATTIFTNIKDTITNIFTLARTNISNIWDNIATKLSNVWNSIKDTAKAAWEGIWSVIKGVINSIIGGINLFINAWNSIRLDVPEVDIPFVGTVGGFSIGVPRIPSIPMLARGGIVDQPTLAMIGERGKEAVVPLENTAFVDTLASAVGSAVMAAMQMMGQNSSGSSESGDIVIQVEGTTIARVINPYLEREQQRLGSTIIQPL